jgi:hypothetical protein
MSAGVGYFREGVLMCVCVALQTVETTEYTEWRLPIYGVHPVMIRKSALAAEGGRCTLTPFQLITITYKVAVQYTLLLGGWFLVFKCTAYKCVTVKLVSSVYTTIQG